MEPQLQANLLNQLRRQKVPVTIHLMNGVRLQGVVTAFDPYSILLVRSDRQVLVFKHSISTLEPARRVQLREEGEGAPARKKETDRPPGKRRPGKGKDAPPRAAPDKPEKGAGDGAAAEPAPGKGAKDAAAAEPPAPSGDGAAAPPKGPDGANGGAPDAAPKAAPEPGETPAGAGGD